MLNIFKISKDAKSILFLLGRIQPQKTFLFRRISETANVYETNYIIIMLQNY